MRSETAVDVKQQCIDQNFENPDVVYKRQCLVNPNIPTRNRRTGRNDLKSNQRSNDNDENQSIVNDFTIHNPTNFETALT